MNKRNITLVLLLIATITLCVYLLTNYSKNRKPKNDKLTVVTTLFPLYDFAKNIGGGKADVILLLPPGVEAHTFEPRPEDIIKINEADVFVYTGKFMEPWAEDIIKGAKGASTRVVDASSGIDLMEDDKQNKDDQEQKESEEHGGVDPHIWLDFENAQKMTDAIADAMIDKDAGNAKEYEKNATAYEERLGQLDQKYATGLKNCQSREIVYAGHYAFGYLTKKYGLEYSATQGPSPDAEPTPKDLIGLTRQIKEKNIRTIFFEETSRPKISRILQTETRTRLLPLNNAHNLGKNDFEKNVSFLELMEKNLENLKNGLRCSD